MIGLTLSRERIRAAPPEVRRWLEEQAAGLLGSTPALEPAQPPPAQLVGCSLEEARQILDAIQGLLPAVAVFFELAREPEAEPAPGVRSFQLSDLQRRTRLAAPEQVLASLGVINEALRRMRADAGAVLAAPDGLDACLVAEATSRNVLRLWREIVAARDLPVAPSSLPGAASLEAEDRRPPGAQHDPPGQRSRASRGRLSRRH